MGKLQSKHACKRRENPEGDSFVVSSFLSKRGGESERTEQKTRHIQDLDNCEFKDGQFGEHHCPLEVVLPPEKAEGCESSMQFVNGEEGESNKARKRISLNELECDVSVEDDNRQEWVFTLYDFDNSGKVTKEDMSSLMHTIYDVVDASVNQSCHSKSKTLRVKLTVTPEPSPRRREHNTHTERDWSCSRVEATQQEEVRGGDKRHSTHMRDSLERNHYCVDENTERRNHYLDLAGIENYTSRFETMVPPTVPQDNLTRPSQSQNRSRSHEPDSHCQQRRSQLFSDHCASRALHPTRPPKGASKGGGPTQTRASKCYGHHGGQDVYHLPQQSQPQPHTHSQHPLQHSHSKRLSTRTKGTERLPRISQTMKRQVSNHTGGEEDDLMKRPRTSADSVVTMAERTDSTASSTLSLDQIIPFRGEENHRTERVEIKGSDAPTKLPRYQDGKFCPQHCAPLEVYCKTDRTLICKHCATLQHQGHKKCYTVGAKVFQELDTTFLLEQTLNNVDKNKLMCYLSQNYPQCFETPQVPCDVQDVSKLILERFGSEVALKIALKVMLEKGGHLETIQDRLKSKLQRHLKSKDWVFQGVVLQRKAVLP
ncbi:hypothetical protein KOW79_018940 [Hemibagrus wyckioides]|uniref:Protein naked cuticle homolog n=1 Tax=Hemibagrus wyckioides TaxID=337641 RepID=A0A9D3N934_9TELE|nr:hypothetical protein KOW79_018940 [Hemibagrus wyckioides]